MKIFLVLIVSFLTNSICAQTLACKDFKTGEFELRSEYFEPVQMSRTETLQKEYSKQYNATMEGAIKWVSDCSYELIYTVAPQDVLGKKIVVNIISIENSKAICSSTFEEMPGFEFKFEMIKIR